MKKVLYVIIGILLLYIVLAFIGPKNVKVERQISINKPSQAVKSKLTDFKFFHDKWSPWTEKDPAMVVTYSGTPGEVGHSMSWSGNKEVGKGEMALAGFNGDTILQRLSFDGQGDSKSYYILKDNNASTDVTWGISFDIGFMGRPIMLFMNMESMMAPDFEKGLSNMKREIESLSDETAKANYEVHEQNWEAVTYVGKKETVAFEKMPEFFGKNYPAIMTELGKGKIEPLAAPSAIYTKYDEKEGKAEVAAVMKVPAGTKAKGWETFSFPASKVLHIAYYGDYAKSMDAHMAMDSYIKEKGLKQGAVIEEYVTDPMSEKDTTKWLTNIYYMVQ